MVRIDFDLGLLDLDEGFFFKHSLNL